MTSRIPPRSGTAFKLQKGQLLTVIDPEGRVVYADFRLDPARFLAALGAEDAEMRRA